jgi:hypothetical protein
MNQSLEEWRPIPGFAHWYEASSQGRIRSAQRIEENKNGVRRVVGGRVLKPASRRDGYLQLSLRTPSGQVVTRYVHYLVATTFVGPCPGIYGSRKGEWNVDHIDEKRDNNKPDNLRWLTREDNLYGRYGGTKVNGERHHNALLSESDVMAIRSSGDSGVALAARYGVSPSTICGIKKGRRWKRLPEAHADEGDPTANTKMIT